MFSPRLARPDLANSGGANAESPSHFGLGQAALSDPPHVFPGELGLRGLFSRVPSLRVVARNMSPVLALLDQADRGLVNTEPVRQHSLGLSAGPDLLDLVGGESRSTDPFAPYISTALNHLGDVVVAGPEMKMGRLNADGPVTGVKYVQSFSRPMVDLVREKVRSVGATTHLGVREAIGAAGARSIGHSTRLLQPRRWKGY